MFSLDSIAHALPWNIRSHQMICRPEIPRFPVPYYWDGVEVKMAGVFLLYTIISLGNKKMGKNRRSESAAPWLHFDAERTGIPSQVLTSWVNLSFSPDQTGEGTSRRPILVDRGGLASVFMEVDLYRSGKPVGPD